MPRLRTFMSPVRYRLSSVGASAAAPFQDLPHVESGGQEIYWLDELLEGGLEVPEGTWNQQPHDPAFILLLSGPPGTGKSTFALELCYNLARKIQPLDGDTWRSLYVSAESPAPRIIENAKSFGWDTRHFRVFDGKPLKRSCCTIYGSERLEVTGKNFDEEDYEEFFRSFAQTWLREVGNDIWEIIPDEILGRKRRTPRGEALPPDVVVIDSLNVFQPDPSTPGGTPLGKAFRMLQTWIAKGKKSPRLLVVILDGHSDSSSRSPWEFLVDAVFRFDAGETLVGLEGYYLRSFQIMKIKTQEHAWGKQIFKIYPGSKDKNAVCARPHVPPYLKSGGAFVFPSVHWHISHSDRFQPSDFHRESFYPTGLAELDSILGDEKDQNLSGFPAMKTTALVGRRGAMKSHLAYYFMLSHALGTISRDHETKNVLLVSLRDDLAAAKHTLSKIVEQQKLLGESTDGSKVIQTLIDSDRLEILHNPPGCISPGEFCHRMFVALARKRHAKQLNRGRQKLSAPRRKTAEIVVLNGLDHLDAKFPLCAGEKVFTPALVTLFRSNRVSSVIISADEGRGPRYADIGPLADLILEFSEIGRGTTPPKTESEVRRQCKVPNEVTQAIEVAALRVPAGQVGGRWGVLGRNKLGAMSFYVPVEPTAATEQANPLA